MSSEEREPEAADLGDEEVAGEDQPKSGDSALGESELGGGESSGDLGVPPNPD